MFAHTKEKRNFFSYPGSWSQTYQTVLFKKIVLSNWKDMVWQRQEFPTKESHFSRNSAFTNSLKRHKKYKLYPLQKNIKRKVLFCGSFAQILEFCYYTENNCSPIMHTPRINASQPIERKHLHKFITRRSFCVNARGTNARRVASAHYAVLCNGGGGWKWGAPWDMGYPLTWGIPGHGVHPRDGVPLPEMGYPRLEMGYPPTQTWYGLPPYPDLRWGTPPRPEMGYSPTQTWDGVPSPPTQTWDKVPPPRKLNRHTPVKT